jgi:thiamine biosynthesis lipoprotein
MQCGGGYGMLPDMVRTWITGLLIVLAGLAALPAQPGGKLERLTFQQPHMGTLFRLVLYAPDKMSAQHAADAAFARIAQLNKIMSDYLKDSELSRLSAQAGGRPVKVSEELFTVLQKADEIAKQTDGAFDVSVGPLVHLWRKARKTKTLPDPDDLKEALARVDYRQIKLDPELRTVHLLVLGMLLDLGGIAKGYAADEALAVLRKHGITRALVAASGDVRAGDPPPDAPGWKVGITPLKDPSGPPTHYLIIKNAAVSTAGDAHQYLEIDGKRYSHIVDPKTGLGLLGRRAVTVIAPDGISADALDTAAYVLGPERGLELIEKQPGCAAIFVWEADGRVEAKMSSRFAPYIIKD